MGAFVSISTLNNMGTLQTKLDALRNTKDTTMTQWETINQKFLAAIKLLIEIDDLVADEQGPERDDEKTCHKQVERAHEHLIAAHSSWNAAKSNVDDYERHRQELAYMLKCR